VKPKDTGILCVIGQQESRQAYRSAAGTLAIALAITLAQRSVLKLKAHVFGAATGDGIEGAPPPVTVGTELGAGTELGTSLGTELGNELASCELALASATPSTKRLRRTLVRSGTFIVACFPGVVLGCCSLSVPSRLTRRKGEFHGRSRHSSSRVHCVVDKSFRHGFSLG
jgi:hypothetical protein